MVVGRALEKAQTDQQAIEMHVASTRKWSLLIMHNKPRPIKLRCAVEKLMSGEGRADWRVGMRNSYAV